MVQFVVDWDHTEIPARVLKVTPSPVQDLGVRPIVSEDSDTLLPLVTKTTTSSRVSPVSRLESVGVYDPGVRLVFVPRLSSVRGLQREHQSTYTRRNSSLPLGDLPTVLCLPSSLEAV